MTYLLAVLAALCFGLNWVLQQHEAAQAPDLELSPVRLLAVVVRRPLWLVGLAALVVGSGLQAAALGVGSLGEVEPLLVLGLPFALALGVRVSDQPVTAREWLGAVGVCAGLAALLAVGEPGKGQRVGVAGLWLTAGVVTAGALCGLLLAGWRTSSETWRAVAFATAAGITFGVVDALSKSMFLVAAGGFGRLLTAWQTYATAGGGVVAVALSQSAYQAAPLRVSLPSLAVAEPVVGVVYGVVVLGGTFTHSAGAVVVEVVAAALVMVGAIALARSPVVAGAEPAAAERDQNAVPAGSPGGSGRG